MTRTPPLNLALTLSVLVLSACNESTTPTQPEMNGDESPAPSFALASNSPQFAAASGLGTWRPKAPMPVEIQQSAVGVATNAEGRTILYVFGGSSSRGRVETYDPVANTWRRRSNTFVTGPLVRTNGVGRINDMLYITGGDGTGISRRLFAYKPSNNSWREKRPLPIASWGGVTSVIDRKLYVLTAGCPECPGTTVGRRLYRYDPRTNNWTRLADCPNLHVLGVGGAIGGKFYVAGGDRDDDNAVGGSDKVDVYDPATNTWAALAPMPSKRHLAAGAVLGNKLYVMGGTDDADVFSTVEAYDPVTNKWQTRAPLPTARFSLAAGTVRNAAGVSQIVALGGGDNGTLGVVRTNEVYTR